MCSNNVVLANLRISELKRFESFGEDEDDHGIPGEDTVDHHDGMHYYNIRFMQVWASSRESLPTCTH